MTEKTMPDHAHSDSPDVQAQLDRLATLGPGRDALGLGRIRALLDKLGNPERDLPPVFHVAGTNGKGSTVAFLRAALEASGHDVHVYTSPHLVRFNERFRIAGKLIADDALAALLADVLDAADGTGVTFFEATTAAMFLAFSREPADAALIEVGLGGRLDATNVIETPLVTAIVALGIDHESFLLSPEEGTPSLPAARIGWEKAGIAKKGAPLVICRYPAGVREIVADQAEAKGTFVIEMGEEWHVAEHEGRLIYRDHRGTLKLPRPRLPGPHQIHNAGLAIAMLRHQERLAVPEAALSSAMRWASWPARLQRLAEGPLTAISPGRDYWLDGGHNRDAGVALARHFDGADECFHIFIGMLANKHPDALLGLLEDKAASVTVLPVPGHEWHDADAFRAAVPALKDRIGAAANVAEALAPLPRDGKPVLICGSLYLAGEVLRANDQAPE